MLHNLSSMSSSLNAQQARLDTIANNIANINSVGYKKNEISFGDAFYREMYAPGMPVARNVRCGAGTMVSGTEKDFSHGLLVNTGRELDLAIDGDGFFGVILHDGSTALCRAGSFCLDGQQNLVNSQGMFVYTDMVVPEDSTGISISESGEIRAFFGDGTWTVIGSIPLFRVTNPSGLMALGDGIYKETPASGNAVQGTAGTDGLGKIKQRFLEQANVDLGEEMANLIVTQRSFQFSANIVRTLDEMWGLANNLVR